MKKLLFAALLAIFIILSLLAISCRSERSVSSERAALLSPRKSIHPKNIRKYKAIAKKHQILANTYKQKLKKDKARAKLNKKRKKINSQKKNRPRSNKPKTYYPPI